MLSLPPLSFLLLILLNPLQFASALPSNPQIKYQPPTTPLSTITSSYPACVQEQRLCGNICYDPTEADCDPQFLSLTKFGEHISMLKKKALAETRKRAQQQQEQEQGQQKEEDKKKKKKKKRTAQKDGASPAAAAAGNPAAEARVIPRKNEFISSGVRYVPVEIKS
ncbi:hypothetical protein TWF730_003482 [Orbilia blumenaviensis]|uniref:Uncharacterized protein n=1 Tax=Orbilia blumenaviensis TaxID=1796055 RepID=A0AAV9U2V7_9PEZI